ncbi:VOC family protein [Bradyrhizobium tropiciagri]|uniref:VOC family protein n=1 Tax=Bradyrhizobium tropiciagri TaxID=312253 RepID=UPI001BABEC4F|nr:VOC family protein [Bradyrhizobium tropiciagri]MBR0899041.1 VOC family protein [Bradyrhizobium tropiciagri]
MTRIPLAQVCYVRLGTRAIEESARFATEILGLQRVTTDNGEAAFRSDALSHRICLTKESPDDQSVGIELLDETFIAPARDTLEARGFVVRDATADECRRRFVRQALITMDGSGNSIELVARPAHSGRRYFPSRDAGIVGFQGVGLRSTNLARDLEFWTTVLGANVADRVGDVCYLQIDARHHRIALYPSERKGVLDVSLEVESLDCVMQSKYFLQDRQVRIVHGPGKETASDQVFLRFLSPDGYVFSYVHGMQDVDLKRRPRQYQLRPESFCSWGSEASDLPELAALPST